ncbi:SDR family NAD(P)-dependent oxidoreductase, partial [Streptomyces seoulensis]|uniref:SDR family NAD(P)-dependent oxidoreductase n=1 Tax=Streptomyces seoulensis TaxID=73044 RepID=UPI0033B0BB27
MSTTEQRVAVVTGAARGIGAATAVRLAAEGHAVAVVDLDEAACKDTVEKITSAGGKALAVGADVSDEAQVEAAVARIAEELGAPVILVNNADRPHRRLRHDRRLAGGVRGRRRAARPRLPRP